MEAESEVLWIVNETDVVIDVVRTDGVRVSAPKQGFGRYDVWGQSLRDCEAWGLRAEVDGVEIGVFGPPACSGEWVITEEMLRAAGVGG